MSFHVAKKCFVENKAFVTPPGSNLEKSLAFNLNNGLANIAQSLASDLSSIENRLARIEQLLAQLDRP